MPVLAVNSPDPIDSGREMDALLDAVHLRIVDRVSALPGECDVHVAAVVLDDEREAG